MPCLALSLSFLSAAVFRFTASRPGGGGAGCGHIRGACAYHPPIRWFDSGLPPTVAARGDGRKLLQEDRDRRANLPDRSSLPSTWYKDVSAGFGLRRRAGGQAGAAKRSRNTSTVLGRTSRVPHTNTASDAHNHVACMSRALIHHILTPFSRRRCPRLLFPMLLHPTMPSIQTAAESRAGRCDGRRFRVGEDGPGGPGEAVQRLSFGRREGRLEVVRPDRGPGMDGHVYLHVYCNVRTTTAVHPSCLSCSFFFGPAGRPRLASLPLLVSSLSRLLPFQARACADGKQHYGVSVLSCAPHPVLIVFFVFVYMFFARVLSSIQSWVLGCVYC